MVKDPETFASFSFRPQVEHIEEVITRFSPTDYEGETEETPIKHGVDQTLLSFNYDEQHRVPCPELGRDIVNGKTWGPCIHRLL
jgi:hypothetical protein